MVFATGPVEGGVAVVGTGPITSGDRAKLVALLDGLPLATPAKVLLLNSPGGSVLEAERLAGTIRSSGLPIALVDNSVCASACFLLFAAAPRKLVEAGSRVGVHSASLDAKENVGTMAATTAMARDASGYGVPASVIGRMVTTEPGQMAWLSDDELRAMDVIVVPNLSSRPATPAPFQAAPVPTPSLPPPGQTAAITPPASVPASPAFQQGAADRKAMETWFAALPPDAHAGALYWASQRSLRQPGSCHIAPPGLDAARAVAWGAGCMEAQSRLAPVDARRKAEPDYRAGWNSL